MLDEKSYYYENDAFITGDDDKQNPSVSTGDEYQLNYMCVHTEIWTWNIEDAGGFKLCRDPKIEGLPRFYLGKLSIRG